MGENLLFYIIGGIIGLYVLFQLGVFNHITGEGVKGFLGLFKKLFDWIVFFLVGFLRSHREFFRHLTTKREDIMVKETMEEINKNGGK